MSRKSTGQMSIPTQEMDEAKKALQERWQRLDLKPATLLHLQELLDTVGVAAAATVTEAVAQEKERQLTAIHIGKEWGEEALRLISLEGIRPHLVDFFRMALESFLAWHLISLPGGSVDNVVEITLTALFLLIGFVGVCLAYQLRSKLLMANKHKQKKSS